jgi:hypothetical protein
LQKAGKVNHNNISRKKVEYTARRKIQKREIEKIKVFFLAEETVC